MSSYIVVSRDSLEEGHEKKNAGRREEAHEEQQSQGAHSRHTNDLEEGFIDNEALEANTVGLVAAPTDYDATRHLHRTSNSTCFACRYVQNKNDAGGDAGMWNEDDVADAYSDLMRLIKENYAKGISNSELVEMIFNFYEREIRSIADYGVWSRQSIFQHLFYHTNEEDVQLQECSTILYSQIQSLRQKTWIENSTEGTVEPHHKNIYLLEKLIKSFTESLTKRKMKGKM